MKACIEYLPYYVFLYLLEKIICHFHFTLTYKDDDDNHLTILGNKFYIESITSIVGCIVCDLFIVAMNDRRNNL